MSKQHNTQNKRLRWRSGSVRVKLIIAFLLILLLPSLAIGGFSYLTAKNQVDAQLQSLTETDIKLVSHIVDQYIQGKMDDVNQLSQQQLSLQEQLELYVQNHAEVEQAVVLQDGQLYYAANDGTGQATGSGQVVLSDIETNLKANDAYTQALTDVGSVKIGEPYISTVTGNTVVMLAKAWANGQATAAIVLDLSELQRLIGEIQIGDNGFVIVFSSNGSSIVSPPWGTGQEGEGTEAGSFTNADIPIEANMAVADTAIDNMPQSMTSTQENMAQKAEETDAAGEQPPMNAMFNGESGQIEQVSPEGDTRSLIYITNELTDWKIAGDRSPSEVTAAAAPILNNTLMVIGLFLIIGALLIAIIVRSITKPLRTLTTASQVISQGNLHERVEVKGNNEFAQLAASFNTMVSSLSAIVSEVTHSSTQLAASSEQLSASASQSTAVTEHIVAVMEPMADGANKQAALAEEGVQTIHNVSGNIVHIVDNAQTAVTATQQAAARATKGGEAMQAAMGQMNMISSSVGGLADVVNRLVNTSAEIGQIMEVISGISQQTNLLALNAAIEAARAGEQGRGFAVVAAEIRKLAEQSSASSQQVALLIAAIGEEVETVASSMTAATREVEAGKHTVQAADELFAEIEQAVHHVNDQVQSMFEVAEHIQQEAKQVVTAIEHIAEVSQQTASGAQTVSAATEQQLASLEEVSSSSTYLTKMATELQELVEKFKL